MPDGLYLLCEGVGCVLSQHCQRYVTGKNVDKHAEGFMWTHNCHEEECPYYLPTSNK